MAREFLVEHHVERNCRILRLIAVQLAKKPVIVTG